MRAGRGGRAVQELLVVRGLVLLVEAGGEAEVGQLDVSTAVEEDVVGFDVAGGDGLAGCESKARMGG